SRAAGPRTGSRCGRHSARSGWRSSAAGSRPRWRRGRIDGMARFFPDLTPAVARARAERLLPFAEWARRHGGPPPAVAPGQVAAIFELLPPEARARPVATDGVARMHRALAALR